IVAISRSGEIIANPPAKTKLMKGDVIGMIGDDAQIEKANAMLTGIASSDGSRK
ncbi:MAG: hypothetical protein JNK51_05895, partial [Blastocatellia bacterium]|nr:hypothetical protein [Blastocatellia bacterium]